MWNTCFHECTLYMLVFSFRPNNSKRQCWEIKLKSIIIFWISLIWYECAWQRQNFTWDWCYLNSVISWNSHIASMRWEYHKFLNGAQEIINLTIFYAFLDKSVLLDKNAYYPTGNILITIRKVFYTSIKQSW